MTDFNWFARVGDNKIEYGHRRFEAISHRYVVYDYLCA